MGNGTFDPVTINDTIVKYFQKVYTSDLISYPNINYPPCHNALFLERNIDIDRPLTRDKIKRIIYSFQPLKSLGPDGLHPIFFKNIVNIQMERYSPLV